MPENRNRKTISTQSQLRHFSVAAPLKNRKDGYRDFLLASLAFWETAEAAEIEDDGKSDLKWRSQTAPEPSKS
jgi:hypothetical protein